MQNSEIHGATVARSAFQTGGAARLDAQIEQARAGRLRGNGFPGRVMADVTVKRLDELPAFGQGVFIAAREALGVSSFGINVERWPPNHAGHPEHDELGRGQEEVYFVLEGSLTLLADGERHLLEQDMFARVGPAVTRKLLPGDEGVTVLCLGAVPGGTYVPSGPV